MPLGEKQQDFYYNDLHDITILSGVTGSGKSYVANLKFYTELVSAPEHATLLLTGKTTEALYKNVIKELLRIDVGINWLRYTRNPGMLSVPHKNIDVPCVGVYSAGAEDRIRGGNIWRWYADEITTYLETSVQMCLSRCRWTIDGVLYTMPAIWTCNPDSPQHFILKKFMRSLDMDVKNYYYGFGDNPTITAEYIKKQKSRYSGVFYERMIMARWTHAEGLVYDDFARDTHVVDKIPHERIKEYILGVDWGYEHPLAILLIGVGDDGQYYVGDEIYEKHRLIDESLKQLLQERGFLDYKITTAYCDSARPEYIATFEDITGIPALPADKKVVEGIQEVQKLLKKRDNGEYGLYVAAHCANTTSEFENYKWLKGKGDTVKDEPEKKLDDALDSLRYAVYTHNQYGDQSIIVI